MKKLFLTLAVVAAISVCNAQFYMGTNLGANYSSGTNKVTGVDEYNTPSTFTFTVAPKLGYQINDKFAVGLALGYGLTRTNTQFTDALVNATDYKSVSTNNTWSATPYFRYSFLHFNDFSLFAEAQINVYGGWGKTETNYTLPILGAQSITYDNPDIFGFGIAVVPGLNYSFNDHFNMDLYMSLFQLYYNHEQTTTNPGDNNEIVTKANKFGIGLYSMPQSYFKVGFNYVF